MNYNLGQKVVDKLTKLSKTGFFKECVTVDFLQTFTKSIKTWLLGGRLGTHHQIQAFRELSWNFLFS